MLHAKTVQALELAPTVLNTDGVWKHCRPVMVTMGKMIFHTQETLYLSNVRQNSKNALRGYYASTNLQGVPEKTHFQNATERPRDKNGPTDPRAHSEIHIIMTTEGFWPEDAL